MIIPIEEIENASEEYSSDKSSSFIFRETHKRDFKAGVDFAESKFEELAIKFCKYAASYGLYHIVHGNGVELFKEFVKENYDNM